MSIILYKEIVYLMILAAPRAPLPKNIRQKYRCRTVRSGVSKAVKSRTAPRAKKKKEENERWSYDLID